jgi:CRP-like cAMP-binding protein
VGDGQQGRRPFLAAATPDAVVELTSLGTRRRFPPAAAVFLEGDVAHEALVLLEGSVKISVTARDGKEIILDVVGEGSLVGELSAVDGQNRSATAIALTPIEVLAVPCRTFIELMHRRPALMYELLVSITVRLRSSVRRQLEYGAGDALGRLCVRLLELAADYGHSVTDGRIEFDLPVSQSDLASWTGLSREAVVKALRNLRQLGWIENHGRHIIVNRPDRLRARAIT